MNSSSEHKSPRSRAYNSAVREDAARQTRLRIVHAAAERFTTAGYAATTMRSIATAAGVSVETVNGNGPKRDLLFAAFELAFTGSEGNAPVSSRADFAFALETDDASEMLRRTVHAATDAFARADGIWRALTAAADVDPAVAEALTELVHRRRREFSLAVTELQRRGLASGVPLERAVDIATLVLSPESYHHLVSLCDWTQEDYERWAAQTLAGQLAELAASASPVRRRAGS
ncbi:MAG TPA: TetR family transcriptional regulator [Microbacteriaceae bacterium]|jgi:AcrR family transcriptional regulator|nr:TetR family transcriptional regulator [Microbacteriaceae bacterium]